MAIVSGYRCCNPGYRKRRFIPRPGGCIPYRRSRSGKTGYPQNLKDPRRRASRWVWRVCSSPGGCSRRDRRVPSATRVSERLGRITSTEIAPAFVGVWSPPRIRFYNDRMRTRGLPELDATALIPESVRTGRTQFPVEPRAGPLPSTSGTFPPGREPLGFLRTRAEGGFHATDAPFRRAQQSHSVRGRMKAAGFPSHHRLARISYGSELL